MLKKKKKGSYLISLVILDLGMAVGKFSVKKVFKNNLLPGNRIHCRVVWHRQLVLHLPLCPSNLSCPEFFQAVALCACQGNLLLYKSHLGFILWISFILFAVVYFLLWKISNLYKRRTQQYNEPLFLILHCQQLSWLILFHLLLLSISSHPIFFKANSRQEQLYTNQFSFVVFRAPF